MLMSNIIKNSIMLSNNPEVPLKDLLQNKDIKKRNIIISEITLIQNIIINISIIIIEIQVVVKVPTINSSNLNFIIN